MKTLDFSSVPPFMFAPEHGGNAVHGGGHPADDSTPASEAIDEGQGYSVSGHAKTAGTADLGTPGSKTNPVSQGNVAELAHRLWEEEGRPDGKADEHWRRAEEQLGHKERR